MMSPNAQTNPMLSLRMYLFLGFVLVATDAFNLNTPRPSTLPLRPTTALGLQRRWLSRGKQFRRNGKRQDVVVNQSSYPLGQPGFVEDTTTAPKRVEISSRRLRIREQWRRKLERDAMASLEPVSQQELQEEEEQQPQQKSNPKAATVTSSTMNLVKVILGTGVLALPNGLAAVSDFPIALVPASALLVVLGLFSAYTFQLYGRLTHETQAKSMGDVWEQTVGKKSSWLISASTFAFCFGCALTYSLVIGDFLSSLAMSLGSGVPALLAKRQFWILSVTLSTLAPLCSLKSLAALAPMSMIGTAGTILTTLFMAFRCPAIVASSPYSVAPGAIGTFAAASLKATPALAPQFNTFSKILSPAALIIASMATTAYLGHFNAPELYQGFKKTKSIIDDDGEATVGEKVSTKDSEKALRKYGIMTGIGFAGVTVWNIIILALGFLTFGGNSSGVILSNYATADKGAVISRLLMTLSVIGGYPFMVRACKSTFVQLYSDFRKGKVESESKMEKWVGRSLLAIVTSLSLLVSDAGLVVSLNGALMGSAIIYVFPALMFLAHTGKQMKVAGNMVSKRLRLERWASRFLVTFGVVSGLIGAAVSVVNSCAPHLLL